ncbi:hypothetical protein ILYODFUR_016037 [Ilyodon furcidens]|uniref:Uncharacterized protein n=1 Tax=Ilyodon furcidens TaxID=33524 RepID=A0ABV0T8F0_9TELE
MNLDLMTVSHEKSQMQKDTHSTHRPPYTSGQQPMPLQSQLQIKSLNTCVLISTLWRVLLYYLTIDYYAVAKQR